MRAAIEDLLWIDNHTDLENVREVLRLGVHVVIDLASNELPVQYPRDIIYCRFPLNYGLGNYAASLQSAITTAANFLTAEILMLVSCSAGMSRSLAIAAAAVAIAKNVSPDDTLLRLASLGRMMFLRLCGARLERIVLKGGKGENET